MGEILNDSGRGGKGRLRFSLGSLQASRANLGVGRRLLTQEISSYLAETLRAKVLDTRVPLPDFLILYKFRRQGLVDDLSV